MHGSLSRREAPHRLSPLRGARKSLPSAPRVSPRARAHRLSPSRARKCAPEVHLQSVFQCFRHTAGFHARVILDGAACRLRELGDVRGLLVVLAVNLVVLIVLRVLVSW